MLKEPRYKRGICVAPGLKHNLLEEPNLQSNGASQDGCHKSMAWKHCCASSGHTVLSLRSLTWRLHLHAFFSKLKKKKCEPMASCKRYRHEYTKVWRTTSAGVNTVFSGFAMRPDQMFAARKSSSTGREADAPNLGQRTSGWHQKRCSLDEHCVTYHALAAREGDITEETSTLSFFHTTHKIIAIDTDDILERHTTWSSFTSCSRKTAPPIPLVAMIQLFFNYFSPSPASGNGLSQNGLSQTAQIALRKNEPLRRGWASRFACFCALSLYCCVEKQCLHQESFTT